MSGPTCKACGGGYRKGRKRLLLEQDGSLTSALVCPSCAGRAVSIVAPLLPVLAPKAADAEVLFLKNAVRAAKRKMRIYIATAGTSEKASIANPIAPRSEAKFYSGRADGLTMALGLLEIIEDGRMP